MDAPMALDEMLRRRGMSRYALSKKLGKSPNYAQNIIGRGTDVSSANLARMAHAMGFRLVLVGDGEPIEIGEEEPGSGCDESSGQQNR